MTGEIYTSVMAANEYNYTRFGKFASEMEQILDILYIAGDERMYKSLNNYCVDLETKQLVFKPREINYL